MRDEEVRKIRRDMSPEKNISPKQKSSTKKLNRRPRKDDIMKNSLDLDDRSSPPIERLSNEEANWQHEAEQFTPPDWKIFPRSNGMSFNMAEVTSIGESDSELSDPLPLGY